MANTYVRPEVTIRPAKKRQIGYVVKVDKDKSDCLMVKRIDSRGRSLGNVGRVLRDGTLRLREPYASRIEKIMDKVVWNKIETVLDLLYGVNRTEDYIPRSVGSGTVIEFRNNL